MLGQISAALSFPVGCSVSEGENNSIDQDIASKLKGLISHFVSVSACFFSLSLFQIWRYEKTHWLCYTRYLVQIR